MIEVTLNYDDEKGTSSKIKVESTARMLKIVNEQDKILHLFELMESDQYFEIPVIDKESQSVNIRWNKYKDKFRKP